MNARLHRMLVFVVTLISTVLSVSLEDSGIDIELRANNCPSGTNWDNGVCR